YSWCSVSLQALQLLSQAVKWPSLISWHISDLRLRCLFRTAASSQFYIVLFSCILRPRVRACGVLTACAVHPPPNSSNLSNGDSIMKRIIVLVSLVATIAVSAFGQAAPAPPPMTLKVGDMAPDFTLPSTAGGTVKLSDFRGKNNVVLAFFVLA